MAYYPPPDANQPIFNKSSFIQQDDYLTYETAENNFLRYPQAQGTERLANIIIGGSITTPILNAPYLGTDSDGNIVSTSGSVLTADRVVITNASGIIDASDTTITTLSYLDATSSIQDQLDNTVKLTGDQTIDGNKNFNDDIVISGDLAITGNLEVSGTQTIINTESLTVEDNMIIINSNQIGTPSPLLESGLEVERGDEPNYFSIFQESTNTWRIGEDGDTQAVATRNDTMTDQSVAYWNDTNKRFDASSISKTELEYLDNVSSNIQTQIDATVKLTGSQTITGVKNFSAGLNVLTSTVAFASTGLAGRITSSGGALYIQAGDTSTSGATAPIIFSGYLGTPQHARFDANGDFGINTADPQEKLHVNGNIRCDNLTVSRVLISDASNNITSSSITTTQLGYLSGATANIQTQIDGTVKTTGDQTIAGQKTFSNAATFSSNLFLGLTNTTLDLGNSTTNINKLTIGGTTNKDRFIRFRRGGSSPVGNAGIQFSNNDTESFMMMANFGLQVYYNAGNPETFGSYGTNYFCIKPSGRVGINQDTPGEMLHVSNGNIRCDNLTADTVLYSDASKNITSSTITPTELGYLSGASSNIQDQLDAKGDVITGAATSVVSSDLTPDVVLVSDSLGKIGTSSITATELGYLDGITVNIQEDLTSLRTDLDGLGAAFVGLSATVDTKQDIITGAATSITSSDLSTNLVLVSDGSGKVATSTITSTELSYLDGVTSNIQTQIDALEIEVRQSNSTGASPGVITKVGDISGKSTCDVSGDLTLNWSSLGITWAATKVPNLQLTSQTNNTTLHINILSNTQATIESWSGGSKSGPCTVLWRAVGPLA